MTKTIKNEISNLNKEFERIKKLDFVDSINKKSKGNAGITFEKLLGKENDNFQIPDYNGIEIKVKNENISKIIRLFTLVPSNSFGFQLKRIRSSYGVNDKQFKNLKTINCCVNTTKDSKLVNGYSFKLAMDYPKEKLFLEIYKCNKLIEKEIYWDFDDLIKTFYRKLQILAIIYYKKRIQNNNIQFSYTNIRYFKSKTHIIFLNLLEKGIVKINIDLGIYRSGNKKGKIHDNGIFFYIDNCNLEMLYKEIILNKKTIFKR